MNLIEQMKIVLELARQNIADQLDHPDMHKEQEAACDGVQEWIEDITGESL